MIQFCILAIDFLNLIKNSDLITQSHNILLLIFMIIKYIIGHKIYNHILINAKCFNEIQSKRH